MHRDPKWKNVCALVSSPLATAVAPMALLATTSCNSPIGAEAGIVGGPLGKVAYVQNQPDSDRATLTVERVAQEKAHWCWAACAQMIHAAHGRSYAQSELARRVHGDGEDPGPEGRAAAYRELLIALSPSAAPDLLDALRQSLKTASASGAKTGIALDPLGAFLAHFAHHAVNSDDLVDALRAGSPALVVLDEGPDAGLEHAYVVRGAGWTRSLRSRAEELGDFDLADHASLELLRRSPFTIDGVLLKHPLVWVELIDPDPAAVDDPGAIGTGDHAPPPAFPRLSGKQFAERARLILSPKKAQEILEAQHRFVAPKAAPGSGGAR